MALNKNSRGSWWTRLHFVLRFIGLSGLLAAGIGAGLAAITQFWSSWESVRDRSQEVWKGEPINPVTRWAVLLIVIGGSLALVALLVEVILIARMVAGRRSAFGFNAVVQVALAIGLVVGINLYSYRHYYRLDWTQDKQFTLDDKTQKDLLRLKGKKDEKDEKGEKDRTTIVVYQLHKSFGRLSDKPDTTDYAAERKIVEKVQDLAKQLEEFGQQLNVVVLDVEEEDYSDKLNRVTSDDLREAIKRAEENSIFFHDPKSGTVQAMSFNEFYLLDKTASAEEKNLVLLKQGTQSFTNKILNIDQKRPRIGVLVIHEWLTTEGPEEYGLAGLKKSLTARGFDVQDVVLKKWTDTGPPEPAVYTYDESKYERLEDVLTEVNADIKELEQDLKDIDATLDLLRNSTLAELTKKFSRQLGGRQVTEAMRKRQIEGWEQEKAFRQVVLTQKREERDEATRERAKLNVEGLAEQRRVTDLKAKLNRMLAGFDLLIIPRMTLRNVTIGDRIPNRVYRLEETQVEAIREYLKSGKPILACFGPSNEPAERFDPGQAGSDGLENLLTQLGVRMPRQTVLFNDESRSFAERKSGLLVSGADVKVPPVDFEWRPGTGDFRLPEEPPSWQPNPIRESMRLVARSVGRDLRLDEAEERSERPDREEKVNLVSQFELRMRHPRPVYFEPRKGKEPKFDPVFMMTSPASWNDDNPFPTRERTPRPERTKPDDPAYGTPEARRSGPFPIGIAVETEVPESWYDDKSASPAQVRFAVIGHGGWFVAQELSPGREKLLLNAVNWLLRRDELLPRDKEDQRWRYPRVVLSDQEKFIWLQGTQWALPGLFLYLGFMVFLVRRMR